MKAGALQNFLGFTFKVFLIIKDLQKESIFFVVLSNVHIDLQDVSN